MKFLTIENISTFVVLILAPFLIISRTTADLMVVSVSLFFLYYSYKKKDFHWLKEKWFQYFIIFWIYLLTINTFFSVNPTNTFFYALSIIRWPLFALAISILFSNRRYYKLFLWSLSFTIFFVIFDVWYQYIFRYDIFGFPAYDIVRLTGPFRHNPVPGIFITRYLFLLITLFLFYRVSISNNLKLFIACSLIIIGLFSVFITGERMSFILYLSSAILVGSSLLYKHPYFKLIMLFSIFFVFSLLLIFFLIDENITNRMFYSTFDKLTNFSTSDYGILYKVALNSWLENPLVGGGLHQFKNIYPLYGPEVVDGVGKILHAHNRPLGLLAETGVLGLILYYAVIYQILKFCFNLIKDNKNISQFILLLNLVYLCFFPFMTAYSFSHNWMEAMIWCVTGFVLMLSKSEKNV